MENIWLWGPPIAGVIFSIGFFVGTLFAALMIDRRNAEKEGDRK